MPSYHFSFSDSDFTDEEKRNFWISIHINRTCPICGANDSFLVGPSGGGSINIECSPCHTQFWTTPFIQFGAYPTQSPIAIPPEKRFLHD